MALKPRRRSTIPAKAELQDAIDAFMNVCLRIPEGAVADEELVATISTLLSSQPKAKKVVLSFSAENSLTSQIADAMYRYVMLGEYESRTALYRAFTGAVALFLERC